MADIGDLLGTLMVGLVRARQLADEAAAAAAERYRQHPLLEGMSVPRVRVPELTVELPVLMKEDDPGEPAVPEKPEVVATEVAKALDAAARAKALRLPEGLVPRYQAEFSADLARANLTGATATAARGKAAFARPLTREGVARVAVNVLARVIAPERIEGLTADVVRGLSDAVGARAEETAVKTEGRAPTLSASILTAEVKDQAASANTARIRLTLREEGLEWTATTARDGTTVRRLTPE